MASVNEKMTAIADGFRNSRGLTEKIGLDRMAELAAVPLGAMLPTLENPGSADDLVEGKELIGPDGEIVRGNIQLSVGLKYSSVEPEFKEDGKAYARATVSRTVTLQSGSEISMALDLEKWTGGSY